MLPYSTYNIPENPRTDDPVEGKWLWMITDKTLTAEDEALLQKIASALKADFNSEVHCLHLHEDETISQISFPGNRHGLVLSFGVPPSSLGYWVDLEKAGMVSLEKCTIILTSNLEKLSSSNTSKQALWRSMQVFMEKQYPSA